MLIILQFAKILFLINQLVNTEGGLFIGWIITVLIIVGFLVFCLWLIIRFIKSINNLAESIDKLAEKNAASKSENSDEG